MGGGGRGREGGEGGRGMEGDGEYVPLCLFLHFFIYFHLI